MTKLQDDWNNAKGQIFAENAISMTDKPIVSNTGLGGGPIVA